MPESATPSRPSPLACDSSSSRRTAVGTDRWDRTPGSSRPQAAPVYARIARASEHIAHSITDGRHSRPSPINHPIHSPSGKPPRHYRHLRAAAEAQPSPIAELLLEMQPGPHHKGGKDDPCRQFTINAMARPGPLHHSRLREGPDKADRLTLLSCSRRA